MLNLFGNASTTSTATWNPGHHERSTPGILCMCVSTLILCLYTSLNLNIVKDVGYSWELYKKKALWMVVGLMFPELVSTRHHWRSL